jgi:hypothetical protein
MGSAAAPKAVEVSAAELTSSAYGATVTFRATGHTVQVADPSLVTIVGPDGKPFMSAPVNNNGAVRIRFPNIGDKMEDGTVYCGMSPSTGTAMFAMPVDSGGKMSWDKAVEFTQTLVAFGHKGSQQATAKLLKDASKDDGGWRMPTREELDVLYMNKDKIGGFSPSWYWSSSGYGRYYAYSQHFDDGNRSSHDQGWAGGLVRSVRSLAR